MIIVVMKSSPTQHNPLEFVPYTVHIHKAIASYSIFVPGVCSNHERVFSANCKQFK